MLRSTTGGRSVITAESCRTTTSRMAPQPQLQGQKPDLSATKAGIDVFFIELYSCTANRCTISCAFLTGSLNMRPPHDPWTGLGQAWPMPWSAPSPYGAPPAYTGAWVPGLRPSTGAPGLLGSRPPQQAYTAYAPLY